MGCLGTCGKIFVSIFAFLFLACSVIGTILPFFRVSDNGITHSVTLFQLRTSNSSDYIDANAIWSNSSTSTWVRDNDCKAFRSQFIAAQALAIATAGIILIAFICSLIHFCVRCCGCVVGGLLALGFACEAAIIGLTLNGWFNGYCANTPEVIPPFRDSYKIVEGFGLHAAALGGFLILCIVEAMV